MSTSTIKIAVVAAAVALSGAPAPADAWRLDFYFGSACNGTKTTAYGDGDSCIAVGSGSSSAITVVCDTAESTSAWSYNVYNNTACSGTATDTYPGDNSESCTTISDGAVATTAMVDCGASACFSANSEVTLEGGARVPMSQLNPGDRVLSADESGNLFYDKVFRVTHWDQETVAGHVRITTDSGHVLELTPNHYVHAGGLGGDSLKTAGEVAEGDELFVVGEDGAVTAASVASAERVSGQGLFNVHTLSGRIVVNGVVSSHFSTSTTWSDYAKLSVAPYWYTALDTVTSLLGNAENARAEAGGAQ